MLNRVRQLKKEASGAKQAGFTIIEVMIVLAIAGLIMAIVFLAIPALQRNNRNTQRKNDVSRIAGQINDYIANNNGKLPTGIYFSGATVPAQTATVLPLDLTKETYSVIDVASMNNNAMIPTKLTGNLAASGTPQLDNPGTATGTSVPPKADGVFYYTNANCGGTNIPQKANSARSFALWYGIEGSTTYQCVEG